MMIVRRGGRRGVILKVNFQILKSVSAKADGEV